MPSQYSAIYHRRDVVIGTHWYATPEAAQDQLMKRAEVGRFHHLGVVRGDVFANGACTIAPRNGGVVHVLERTGNRRRRGGAS